MSRIIRAFLAVILLATLAAPAAAKPKESVFERHSYTNPAGTRDYLLYIPAKLKKNAPLVVYLHGCNQTADDAALGTRYNALAEEEGFVVVYPEQDPAANGSRCWQWFLPDHWHRDAGEPSIIAGITRSVQQTYGLDVGRTYMFGVSAGGAMSSIMAASYPDLYAATGIYAAPAYAGDVTGQAAYETMGDHARAMPMVVFQGTADVLVNYPLGRTALTQWLNTDDLADDGHDNGSVSDQPTTENRAFDQSVSPGGGDACIPPPSSFPCANGVTGFQEQYPHTIESFAGADGETLLQMWSIHGLGHAYGGGDPDGSFVDPLGPDVTRSAYEFFINYSLEGV
ncbi:MAG TPA: PHB depolymerase family esterase [Actinomycetota bacterium]|nr:PHB depolymerase family esterase [Actinomycetota bacterium]